MTGNTHVTEGLTQWICSESHDRLPAAVREKTVDVIYDSVGGMAHGDEVDPVHSTSVGGHVAAGPVPTALTVGE
jgi:hypothetical protein